VYSPTRIYSGNNPRPKKLNNIKGAPPFSRFVREGGVVDFAGLAAGYVRSRQPLCQFPLQTSGPLLSPRKPLPRSETGIHLEGSFLCAAPVCPASNRESPFGYRYSGFSHFRLNFYTRTCPPRRPTKSSTPSPEDRAGILPAMLSSLLTEPYTAPPRMTPVVPVT
jgi:hypothetical protein